MPTRRDFLANSGAVAATLAWPSLAHAQLQLGEMQIDVVSDGSLTLPGDFIFAPMPQDELDPILKEFGQSRETLTPECNVTLFTEASYMIGKTEWDYWMNPNTVDEIGEARTSFAVGAKRRLEMIEDNIAFFEDGQEIMPGVAARASYGHTPGHMSFEVRNGNTSAMIVGDSIGNHHVAFARPDWTSGSDQDPETAAQTRLSLLDQLSSAKMQLIGFHLPGGLGHVEKSGDAYTFVGGA